jgi:type IV pilus assembly protein PilE
MNPKPTQKGLTLIELMITVAVVAILSAIAYPSYTNYVTKSRRADATAMLMQIMQAEQRAYTANSSYDTNLTNIGFPLEKEVPSEGNHYKITATACGSGITSCVRLTAVPQHADAKCANLILDSTGAKSVSGTLSADKCW